jgi:hypothetical protein
MVILYFLLSPIVLTLIGLFSGIAFYLFFRNQLILPAQLIQVSLVPAVLISSFYTFFNYKGITQQKFRNHYISVVFAEIIGGGGGGGGGGHGS